MCVCVCGVCVRVYVWCVVSGVCERERERVVCVRVYVCVSVRGSLHIVRCYTVSPPSTGDAALCAVLLSCVMLPSASDLPTGIPFLCR